MARSDPSRYTSGRGRSGVVSTRGYLGHSSYGLRHGYRYGLGSYYGHSRFLGGSHHFGLHSSLWWPRAHTWGAYGLGFRLGYLSYTNYEFGIGVGFGAYGLGGYDGFGYGCGLGASYYSPRSFWWPSKCYYPNYGTTYVSVPVFYPAAGSTVVVGDRDSIVVATGGEGAVEPIDDSADDGLALERTVESHLRLGDFYFREGRYDEAAESDLRAIVFAPEDGSIHFVASDALFAQGDYHYAAYMIRRALELGPGLATVDLDKREV